MRIRGAEVVLGFAVLGGLMGCSSPPGVVSKEVYDLVNENTRERNYDLAWQEIRALKGSLERGDTRHSVGSNGHLRAWNAWRWARPAPCLV